MDERTRLCKTYFDLGLSYSHILLILAQLHSIVISMSTLKRTLRKGNLFRRKNHADIVDVALFIEGQVSLTSGQNGYRWMHHHLRKNGLNIPRDTVQTLMQIIDPEGVQDRLSRRLKRRAYFSKGPNFLWHLDSYDKLKRYGLCINGCIDGFSRNLLWLNAFHTSSHPKVIAGYYMEVDSAKKGCPFMIRGDKGTENGDVAQMQEFMTERQSFIYGRSTSNQRIEMFWNFLRKHCAQSWMDTLAELSENGLFDGYDLDKGLVQFCFLAVLQKELDLMLELWNSHHIRPTRNEKVPHGKPLIMYSLPELYNTNNYLQEISDEKIAACADECMFRGDSSCYDDELAELCCMYMNENGWDSPKDLQNAVQLYRNLRQGINQDLN